MNTKLYEHKMSNRYINAMVVTIGGCTALYGLLKVITPDPEDLKKVSISPVNIICGISSGYCSNLEKLPKINGHTVTRPDP